jgi:hypothetical protein
MTSWYKRKKNPYSPRKPVELPALPVDANSDSKTSLNMYKIRADAFRDYHSYAITMDRAIVSESVGSYLVHVQRSLAVTIGKIEKRNLCGLAK